MPIVSKCNFISLTLLCAASLVLGGCGNGNNDNVLAIDIGTASNDTSIGDGGTMDVGTGGDSGTAECGAPNGMRPPRLSEHAGAFVPGANDAGGTLVIFGGSLGVPENCGFPQRTYETKTWLYDVACDSWSELGGTTPTGRTRHTAVYDEANNRVLVFGGLAASGPLNDTWALDMTTLEWSEVATSGALPPARLTHASAYDPAGRMLIFGGNTGSVVNIAQVNDVWALDLGTNTWADVTPAGATAPVPRLWVTGLWDTERSQFVIFGGGDSSAFGGTVDYFEDAWAWTDAGGTPSWDQLDAGSTLQPQGRFWAGWTYDAVNSRYVLFGGHDDTDLGNKNDTWFFEPDAGQWSEHRSGDLKINEPLGTCNFPADFTSVDPASPERRNAHVFAPGPTAGYAMGGKTDCGVIDDLVRFNFASEEWEVLTRATVGEVCLRKGGGDTCSSLCL